MQDSYLLEANGVFVLLYGQYGNCKKALMFCSVFNSQPFF